MKNVIRLFEEQVRKQPNSIALYYYNDSISYSNLNYKANQLARELIKKGVKKDTIVGLYIDRSVEMIIGIYAILKTGAAYLPLDPKYPDGRIENIISDSQINIILSSGKNSNKDFSSDLSWILIDNDQNTFSKNDDSNLNIEISDNDLAYVIYTSGSTGNPKGVLIEHKALMTLLDGFNLIAPQGKNENCLSITPFSFDVSVWEFFISIPFGGTLFLRNTSELIDLYKFIEFIYENKISTAYLPPSILPEFVRIINKINKPFPIKRLLLGVEPIKQSVVQSIKNQSDEIVIINGYGPTETTICATFYDFQIVNNPKGIVPIGKAVHGYNVYLVDKEWNQVKMGDAGQILIGGNGLSRGYLNRDELNLERFRILKVKDKVQRFYLTGDYGKYIEDYNIEFIGRKDSQLKIRGHRVEIGEIEYTLKQISGINEAVVIAVKEKNKIVKLKAFYSLKDNVSIDKKELKNHLNKSLPSYMIPSSFVQLGKIPRTSNEKIDRKYLSEYRDSDIGHDEIIKPETQSEFRLFEIWKEVLEYERFSITDNFNDLGGDSINAAMIIIRINEEFQIDINVNDFYRNTDIKTLALFIDAAEEFSYNKDHFEIKKVSRDNDKFSISFNQQELWLLDEFTDSKKSNNISAEIGVQGKIDFNIMKLSIQILLDRYEDLRTYFKFENGETFQCINDQMNFELDSSDLSSSDQDNKSKKQSEIRDLIFNTAIDLSQCPLFKFHFIKISEGEGVLLFVIHHIVFDGWSMGILLTELSQIYSAILQDTVVELPKLNIQNIDYAKWQKEQFAKGLFNKEFNFWKNKLSGQHNDLRITEKQHIGSTSNSGNRTWWRIPENVLKCLTDLSNDHASSLFNTICGFFALFLYKYSLQETIVIGTPYANRKPKETEKLIGYFTNMISLFCEIDPKQSVSQFLENVHRNNLEAYSHSSYPFGQLVKDLKIKRNDKKHPIFQVCFIMQNWRLPEQDFDDIQLSQKEIGNNTSKFDLTLNIEILENELECWFEYKTDLFTELEINEYIIDFNDILCKGYDKPELSIEEFIKSKDSKKSISTVLIGDGSLLIECAIFLLRKKRFSINGIITSDIKILKWCKKNGIECYFQEARITNILERIDYDYLLSIVNEKIIPEAALSFAKISNINYHDSLLPKYAGLFSTSHAIINQEVKCGVSWHIIDEGIDTGDILLQEEVLISKDDTALSLNLKCFDKALKTFDTLTSNIESKDVIPKKQDLSERSYYGMFDRPDNACLIDWNKTAEEIYCLFNSMIFGNTIDNEFGTPKLYLNGKYYIIENLRISDAKSGEKPGTIVNKNEKGFSVSSSTNDIEISKILDIYGRQIEINNILNEIEFNQRLNPDILLTESSRDDLITLFNKAIRSEAYWKSQIDRFEMLDLSFMCKGVDLSKEREFHSISLNDLEISNSKDRESFINKSIAGFLLFLSKISNRDSISVLVENYNLDLKENNLDNLFSKYTPITIDVNQDKNLNEIFNSLINYIKTSFAKGTFLNDIFYRYIDLKSNGSFETFINNPLIISIAGEKEIENPVFFNYILNLIIDTKNQSLSLKYNKNFVNGNDIEYIGNYLSLFFQKFRENPEIDCKKLSLLSDSLRKEIIYKWNNTKLNKDLNKSVVGILDSIAIKSPDLIALEFGDKSYNYQQLNSISNAYAGYIKSLNYTDNFYVAILLDRTPEMIFAILGILKAGCAYIPLDKKYPQERINRIIENSGLSIILTSSKYSNLIPGTIKDKVFVDQQHNEIVSEFSSQNFAGEIHSYNDAYVIYTSGSTGKPKGVRVSHKSLTSFTYAAIELYKIKQEDRMLQFASITFDAAIEEIFPTLCSGACLILRTDEMMESASKFISFCKQWKISIIDLPTSYWHLLVDQTIKDNLKFDKNLRLVILGGEAVSAGWVKSWLDRFNNYPVLINTYGPTETTVVATSYMVNTESYQNPIPIGKPIGNVKTYVVDKNNMLLPPGMPGELLIGGDLVSSGYLNNQLLTEEKFISNTFESNDDNRLYRSGDLVKYDNSGNILFLGRIDKQVKIRGFRIELDEIDSIVKEYNNILDSISILYIDSDNNKKLVNYYISEDDKEIEGYEIRDFLESRLPSYMIPSAFIKMHSFPLTTSLKINYKAFPNPNFSETNSLEINLPENPIQKELYRIFSNVLNVDTLSTQNNFFNLGGDSLSAIEILSKITKVYGDIISLKEFYQYPSIKELDLLISERYQNNISDEVQENISNLISLQDEGERDPVIMIFGDESNLFLPQLLGNDQPYYAFIPLGSEGEKITLKTVEEIADLFAKEIIARFKNISIHLAGYSFGGLIAIELRKRLSSAGFYIKSNTYIDTISPETWNSVVHNVSFRRKLKMSKYRWVRRISLLFGAKVPVKYRNFYILESWQKAYKKYNPGKLDFNFYLIRSTDYIASDSYLGWKKHFRSENISIYTIQGDHHSILKQPESQKELGDTIHRIISI
ncbi:amino acid adenylation domain-containing protein [Bacteroidota bacterium]